MHPQEEFQIGLNRSQKFTLGIVLLILVDVIWVASSELTKVRKFAQVDIKINISFYFIYSTYTKKKLTKSPYLPPMSKLQCFAYTCLASWCILRGETCAFGIHQVHMW
jgi:hypothetical protein